MTDAVRFLFVDDEAPILSVLERALKIDGFVVMTTSDPKSAAAIVAEKDVDVIVCDHMMPAMKGTDVLEEVRRSHAHVVRILVSGSPDRSGIDESVAHRFVEKPWHLAQLKALLEEVAAEVRARRRPRPA